jgi:hypothetical protein
MNRSPSIIIITLFLVVFAMRLVASHPTSSSTLGRLILSVSLIVLAVLSVVAAVEIWRRSERALRQFVVWLIAYLTIGGATQVVFQGVSISEVAIWCVASGALGVAVALHLRYVLRQAV